MRPSHIILIIAMPQPPDGSCGTDSMLHISMTFQICQEYSPFLYTYKTSWFSRCGYVTLTRVRLRHYSYKKQSTERCFIQTIKSLIYFAFVKM